MNAIEKQLFKSGILKLSAQKLQQWAKQGKVGHLIYACEEGLFDIRFEACHYLKPFVTDDKVKEILMKLADDPVDMVGNVAIAILKPLGHGRYDELIRQVMERRERKKALDKELRKRAKTTLGRKDYPSLNEIYNRSRDRHAPDLDSGMLGGFGIGGDFGF